MSPGIDVAQIEQIQHRPRPPGRHVVAAGPRAIATHSGHHRRRASLDNSGTGALWARDFRTGPSKYTQKAAESVPQACARSTYEQQLRLAPRASWRA